MPAVVDDERVVGQPRADRLGDDRRVDSCAGLLGVLEQPRAVRAVGLDERRATTCPREALRPRAPRSALPGSLLRRPRARASRRAARRQRRRGRRRGGRSPARAARRAPARSSHSHDETRQPASRTTSASRRARITASPPISPPWPKKPGSAVETEPRPIWVAVAAAPSWSARRRSSAAAFARTTPPPATRSGRSASRSRAAASPMRADGAVRRRGGSGGASSAPASISTDAARTSAGRPRCTGPGRPESASRTASRTSTGTLLRAVAVALHFVVARISPLTSAAIVIPRAASPRCIGGADVRTSTASPFARAVPRPPTRLCAPGPISP